MKKVKQEKGGKKNNIETILSHFAISLFAHHTIDDILWDVAKNVISKLEFEDCVIYLVDKERNVLVQKAAFGPKNPHGRQIYEPIEIPMGKGIVGSVAETGIPELIYNTANDKRYILDDEFRLSEITVPIKINEEVIGIIDSEHSEKGFFKKWHLRALELIATLCAQKIVNLPNGQFSGAAPARESFKNLKLTALDNRLNPHFLFNSLAAIQHFITLNDSENALKYLSRFGKMIRRSINQVNQDWVSLEEEMELVASYLDLEKLRSGNILDYRIEKTNDPDEPPLIPNLLVHPIVDNLFNQNKAHKIDEKFLTIQMSFSSLKLKISLDFVCKVNGGDPDSISDFEIFDYRRDNFLLDRIDLLKKQLGEDFSMSTSPRLIKFNSSFKIYQSVRLILPLQQKPG